MRSPLHARKIIGNVNDIFEHQSVSKGWNVDLLRQLTNSNVNFLSRDLNDLYATLDNASQSRDNNKEVSLELKNWALS